MHSFTASNAIELDERAHRAHTDALVRSYLGADIELTIHRDLSKVETLWRGMERLSSMSPHQSFAWCHAWVEATGARPLIVVGHRGGRPVALLPLEIVRICGVSVARFIAAPFNNLNFGLFDRSLDDGDPLALDEIAAELHRLAPEVDLVVFGRMPLAWRGRANPFAALRRETTDIPALQVDLEGGFEAVLSRVNAKKRRKKFRLAERRLEEMGGYELVIAESGAAAAEILDAFFEQKRRRFESQGKLDVFARPAVKTFFHRLAAEPGTGDAQPLRLAAIRLGDGRIGAIAGLTFGNGHVICQFGSIDEEIGAELSIGEFLFHNLIERACADGHALYDFGIGDEGYKRSWCTLETAHYDFHMPLTLGGRLLSLALGRVHGFKRLVKTHPRLEKMARAVQRRLHRA